jgi:protein SEY1
MIKRDAEAMFLDAKRALVSGSGSIPIWIIILLIVLGWNEFIAIISSPIYLLLSLIIISSLFIIHHLHLSGPLMTFVCTLSNYLNTPVNSANDADIKAKNE